MASKPRRAPKVFSRPSVNIDRAVNKSWLDLPAERVVIGDVVPGVGIVRDHLVWDTGLVEIRGPQESVFFEPGTSVRVFGVPR